MTIVVGVVIAMLAVAMLLTLIRIVRGPSMLDRMVATDVLLAMIVSALGVEAAYHRHATTVPILVVLPTVGFVGSVTVARFISRRDRPVTRPESHQ